MKNKVPKIMILLASLLLATSCMKDVDNLVHNPYWIHGDFNPTLGVPLAYGEMNLADLLSMMKKQPDNFSITYDEHTDLITLGYDSTFHNRISMGEQQAKSRQYGKKGSRKADAVQTFPFDGIMPISLFDDISNLPDSSQLKLQNVFLTLLCNVSADLQDNAVDAINRYGVSFNLDRARVFGIDHDGDTIPITDPIENIPLTGLASGDVIPISLFDNTDVASIINSRISQICYSVVLRLTVPDSSVLLTAQFIKDSLGINYFDINSDVSLKFPVSGYINGLGYSTDLAMHVGEMNTYDITVDTAQLVLELENALPVELRLQGYLLDSNDNILCNVFTHAAEDTIPAAKVTFNGATNSYVSTQSTTRTHYIPLNQERFEALQHCSKLRLSTYISTSNRDQTNRRLNNAVVTMRGSDKLKARAYLLAQPHLSIDTIINGNKK